LPHLAVENLYSKKLQHRFHLIEVANTFSGTSVLKLAESITRVTMGMLVRCVAAVQ
jgi:hypothetical protein